MAAACPRWYNAALTHSKWMGNPSSPTLSSNCGNRRAPSCQTEAQWPIGYGVGLRIKRSSVRIRCTRENEHPRKRAPDHTTPAYSDTEAKFSSQTQPRKCAPTREFGHPTHCILHTQYILHTVFKTCCWLLTADLTDSEGLAHFQIWICLDTKPVSCLLVFFILFSLRIFAFPKKMHMISPSGIAVHVHTTLPGWCHFENSCRVWNTGVLFVFLISCIALSLQFLASQQNEKIKQKLRLPADKRKKEIIMKMKRHSE